MSRAACAAWNSYELPPTAVVSTSRGVMPRYSGTAMPAMGPVSPASYTASTSARVRPASARARAALSALICHFDTPSTRLDGYSWMPTIAAARAAMRYLRSVETDAPAVDGHGAVVGGGAEQRRPGTAARPVVPDRDDELLARQHRPGEPPGHRVEPVRVGSAERVQQRPAGEAVGAQPVQDRAGEPAACGEGGIGVQRVAVPGQPVEQRLLGPGGVADLFV